jgi:hypothetical protein
MASFSFDSWLKNPRSSLNGTRRNKPRSAVRTIRSTRINLEQLEYRLAPATAVTDAATLLSAAGAMLNGTVNA